MNFKSTRDDKNVVTASQAILQGLAVDGGLYVPVSFPTITEDWQELIGLTYQEVAFKVMHLFFDDFSEEDLRYCVENAYDEKFDNPQIAPVKQVGETAYLELFHGSTIAFKDMALSILPYLMKTAQKINHNEKEIVILTATSGDTGKAAMAGFADVPGTKIIVFYPTDGVSDIQEKQMLTQKGENTFTFAIEGNFDDAQTNVKAILNDEALRQRMADKGIQFSSANSINIGRLIPQVAYYVWAYLRQLEAGQIEAGQEVNFTVPTGNFGNIMAAYYAKRIGLPIGKLICASNDNKVLYDFFKTGTYDRRREFKVTSSPSMDILISSNFERMLYFALNEDSQTLNEKMSNLSTVGYYEIEAEVLDRFEDYVGFYSNEAQVLEQIQSEFKEHDYVLDPHTAVARHCYAQYVEATNDQRANVVVATASPYKFAPVVLEGLTGEQVQGSTESLLKALQTYEKSEFPNTIHEVLNSPLKAKTIIAADKMQDAVESVIFN